VFIVVPRNNILDYLLPNEEEEKSEGLGGELPIELSNFKDVIDLN